MNTRREVSPNGASQLDRATTIMTSPKPARETMPAWPRSDRNRGRIKSESVASRLRRNTHKGYDSRATGQRPGRAGLPVIPRKVNSKERGRFFPKKLCELRARIEQTIGKLKRFKRIARLREDRYLLQRVDQLRLRDIIDQIRSHGLDDYPITRLLRSTSDADLPIPGNRRLQHAQGHSLNSGRWLLRTADWEAMWSVSSRATISAIYRRIVVLPPCYRAASYI